MIKVRHGIKHLFNIFNKFESKNNSKPTYEKPKLWNFFWTKYKNTAYVHLFAHPK